LRYLVTDHCVQVTNWFAERSDVILLFFDPNNPGACAPRPVRCALTAALAGTTRETLEVLTAALGDMDYKLLIVLNKARARARHAVRTHA
jgi:hypothetical protein